jgi:RHS repeat-associated protein
MTSLTDPQGKALSFAYDPEGDLTEVKRPSGVTTTNVYDEAGRLAETSAKDEESTVLEALEYAYDAEGNVTNRNDTRAEAETTYAYDKLGRLIDFNPPGEGSTAYAYDKAGNRTKAGGTTYEYNALNQLTEASSGAKYSYDGAGRMTAIEEGEEETAFEWDLFDHLAKAEGPGGSASYAYDALERLSERKAGETTQVVHYGDLTDRATYDANGEGKTTTSFVAGPGGLLEERSAEATSYPLADAHGDITAISGPTGSVESRQSYDPWGAQLSGPSQEMGYLGAYERPTDPTTGLIQMGARSYSPELGAFVSEDPVLGHVGIGISSNRYPYVWDNPINLYDLNGRDVCVPTPFGDACAGDAADGAKEMGESWAEDPFNFGDPRELVKSAQEYWVHSDSPLSPFAGSAVSIVDIAVNPDRLDYYMKNNHLPGKQLLADCYNSGHPARALGGLVGGTGGFAAGAASARDLGVRGVGVGVVSGSAGAGIGGGIGALGGCAFGLLDGLVH